MKRRSRACVSATGLLVLAALAAGLFTMTACRSAVKDFYEPLLVPPCEGGAGGQATSQGGSMTQSGSGGSAGFGGECVAR